MNCHISTGKILNAGFLYKRCKHFFCSDLILKGINSHVWLFIVFFSSCCYVFVSWELEDDILRYLTGLCFATYVRYFSLDKVVLGQRARRPFYENNMWAEGGPLIILFCLFLKGYRRGFFTAFLFIGGPKKILLFRSTFVC